VWLRRGQRREHSGTISRAPRCLSKIKNFWYDTYRARVYFRLSTSDYIFRAETDNPHDASRGILSFLSIPTTDTPSRIYVTTPTSLEEPTTSVQHVPSHRSSNLAVASYDPLYDHYSFQQQQPAPAIPCNTISATTTAVTTTAPIAVPVNREFQFDTTCKICMQRRIQFVFLKCKHACCCQDCGLQIMDKTLRRCPICKARIEGNCRIYF
jgi:hypothetical protein